MRLFSMYRWVRERHMIGIRGRNFLEAPWAGGENIEPHITSILPLLRVSWMWSSEKTTII